MFIFLKHILAVSFLFFCSLTLNSQDLSVQVNNFLRDNLENNSKFRSRLKLFLIENQSDLNYLSILKELHSSFLTSCGFEYYPCDGDLDEEVVFSLKNPSDIKKFSRKNVLMHTTRSILDILDSGELKQQISDCTREAVFFVRPGFFQASLDYLNRNAKKCNNPIHTIMAVKLKGELVSSEQYTHEILHNGDYKLDENIYALWFPNDEEAEKFFLGIKSNPNWQKITKDLTFFVARKIFDPTKVCGIISTEDSLSSLEFCKFLLSNSFAAPEKFRKELLMHTFNKFYPSGSSSLDSAKEFFELSKYVYSGKEYIEYVKCLLFDIENYENFLMLFNFIFLTEESLAKEDHSLIKLYLENTNQNKEAFSKKYIKLHLGIMKIITGSQYLDEIASWSDLHNDLIKSWSELGELSRNWQLFKKCFNNIRRTHFNKEPFDN